MSVVVPRDIVARIQYYEDHNAPWTSHATQIGTTSTEVAALAVKSAAARAAYDAQQAALNAAKDATLTLRLAVASMSVAGSAIIKKVRAKAATDGPGVYALASIPAPAAPSPVPAPGTPANFVAELSQGGALTLKWKCPNPARSQGTTYQVSRRVGAGGDFVVVGTTGVKRWVDATVPAGTASVTYRIVATRSTAQGPEALFTVNFGVGGGGEVTASVISAPKLAA
jgi:hypothetical protein